MGSLHEQRGTWNLPWCYHPRLISLGGWSGHHRSPGLLRLPGARTVSWGALQSNGPPTPDPDSDLEAEDF